MTTAHLKNVRLHLINRASRERLDELETIAAFASVLRGEEALREADNHMHSISLRPSDEELEKLFPFYRALMAELRKRGEIE